MGELGELVKVGEPVEVRREKNSLPDLFFLFAFGAKRNLTRQAISPVYRLPSHLVVGRGVVIYLLPSHVFPVSRNTP